jgi:hypothetical protein
MTLLTFIAFIGVMVVFERQKRKQWLELAAAYRKAGRDLPARRPLIGKEQAWVSMGLGVLLALTGVGFGYSWFLARNVAGDPVGVGPTTLFLGGGVAVIFSSWRTLRLHGGRT